jgi:cell division protein FtsW (lipid II flippase)
MQIRIRESFDSNVLLALQILSCIFAWQAFGIPNHWYQALFGFLVSILVFQIPLKSSKSAYSAFILNLIILALSLKLFLGAGIRQPFYWLSFPGVEVFSSGSILSWLPKIAWHSSPLSQVSFDFTKIQAGLLIFIFLGSLLRLQMVVSVLCLLLLFLALPGFFDFNWDWVIPSLVCTTCTFYLQSRTLGS